MKPVLLVVVVLAGLLGWVGFRFARYRQSAAVHWRDAVRLRRDALAAALQALGGPPPPDPAAALYDRHFRRLIATIPLDRLAEFPGVGAGTINQLKQAGLTDLPGVAAARVGDIPKVGDKRGNDVLAAAQALLAEARGRFDAGGCPEAIDYRREVAALRVDTTPDMVRQHAVRAATADAVRQLDALLPTADAVTFVGFLLGRPVPGLTPTLLARPLPEPVVPPDPPPFDGPAGAAADPAYTVSPPTKLTKPSKVAASGPLPSAPIGPPADVFRAELDRASAVQVVPSRPGEVPLVAKVRAFARFGILIAKADGRVAQSERKEVRDFLTGTFGYDANLLRHIDPAIEQAEKNSADEPQAVAELRALLSPAECDQLYRFAERVADAAGDRNAKETEALARIAAGLGVSPVRSSEFGVRSSTDGGQPARVSMPDKPTAAPPKPPAPPAVASPAVQEPRQVLDIAASVELSPELIRRKVALLTDPLDPTRAAALGPEFAKLADQKRAAIRAAGEALVAAFGVPLDPPAAPPPPADPRHNPALDDAFGM